MGLSGFNSAPPSSVQAPATSSSSAPFPEDPSKRVRKPYTITKSRENWSEQEHDKFLEALHLFDRDWRKIEAFIGSKTAIQIRSHAQKYFLKVQKSGTSEHLPPPRPKRKASHPYPQKAPRNVTSHVNDPLQASPTLYEPGYAARTDGASVPGNLASNGPLSSCSLSSSAAVNISQATKDDTRVGASMFPRCQSSSNENGLKSLPNTQIIDRDNNQSARVMPDFAQVYKFIGSMFDPNVSGHLQRLEEMNPINLETTLLLMSNLCVNLMNPEFEEHRRLLASYNGDPDRAKAGDPLNLRVGNSENTILSV